MLFLYENQCHKCHLDNTTNLMYCKGRIQRRKF
nr:MAG TPA: cytochrome C6 [Caudoviricetes sp.]